MKAIKIFFSVLCLVSGSVTNAQFGLPAIYSDNMVLQRNTDVDIRGWDNPLQEIRVVASWNTQDTLKTKADRHAKWQLKLPTPAGPGPYKIFINGSEEKILSNILIGEVWLASGQSNMEWTAAQGIEEAEEAVAASTNKNIRFFRVPRRSSEAPQDDVDGYWTESSPETMKYFSAVAYFFGKRLNEEMDVPIGLISSSWGGTPAETWIPEEEFEEDPKLAEGATLLKKDPWCPSEPGRAFNGMIHPLLPFDIAGVIWYQGETNTSNVPYYEHTFSSLIRNWRELWQSEFPFYYAQIAPFKYGDNYAGVEIRDIQRQVLALPKTGMVVTADIGNIDDIHPRNKKDVGLRFANLALEKHYKSINQESESPLVEKVEFKNRKLRVHFKNAAGLKFNNGNRSGLFEVAGKDKNFRPATARVEGDIVVLKSSVTEPQYVRYAWSNTAEADLFNAAGLPASSFKVKIEE